MGGRTRVSAALQRLRSDLFSQRLGARASVPHVAVLITDGGFDELQQTNDEVFGPTRTRSRSLVTLCNLMCSAFDGRRPAEFGAAEFCNLHTKFRRRETESELSFTGAVHVAKYQSFMSYASAHHYQ